MCANKFVGRVKGGACYVVSHEGSRPIPVIKLLVREAGRAYSGAHKLLQIQPSLSQHTPRDIYTHLNATLIARSQKKRFSVSVEFLELPGDIVAVAQ